MGKLSKAQEEAQRRKYMAELRQKERQAAKKMSRIVWLISIVSAIVIVAVVSSVLVLTYLRDKAGQAPKMEDLNFTALSSAEYDKLVLTPNDPSDLVSIKVSYTAADGESKSGNIVVRLFEEVAPQTVANFKKLVSSNHYAASEFHRVLKGFMIQGGDSVSGAGAKSIKGEFSENGFKNNLSHKRGVISMARGDEPNSASDEFFIVHQDTTELDGKYAAFGYVVYGMDIVDEIAALEVEANPKMDGEVSRPVDKVSITSVNFVNFR